jgi:hypothetical protein
MTTLQRDQIIKAKLAVRTNKQLISDAKVAYSNKADETNRMIFALTMDVLAERISEQELEAIYQDIEGDDYQFA